MKSSKSGTSRQLLRMLMVLIVVLVTLPMTAAQAADAHQTGVSATTVDNLNIRTNPGVGNPKIGLIPAGTTVPVLGRNQDSNWALVDYNGVRGWSAARYFTFTGDFNTAPVTRETGQTSVVNTSVSATPTINLNIRSGPSTGFGKIGLAIKGQALPVLGRNADSSWLLIDKDGRRGWIAGWFTNISGDVTSIPVSTASATGQTAQSPVSAPATTNSEIVTATTTVNLRIRSGPSTNSNRLGVAREGAVLTVEGRNADNSWIYADYNGTKGWLAAWFTTISGDLTRVPVRETAVAPQPPPAPVASGSPASGFALGGQTHTFANPDVMRAASMTWVKFQHKWIPGQDPSVVAGRINAAHAEGFRVLFSIPGQSHPSSIDYTSYVNFVKGVALLGADAIEIWNEMNLNREWPSGQVNPSLYVNNMLAPAYNAIKSVNPNTLVISGALAPTGVRVGNDIWPDDQYLAGMRNAGAARYMDCLGVHHNAGATSPLVQSGHPAGSHYSWYLIGTHNVYAGTFPNTPLCYTELGYLTGQGYPPISPSFAWAADNTLAEHALWLGQAVRWLRGTGRVRMTIIYNVDFIHYSEDPQAGYAILRPDGSCPACETLASAMR